MNAPLRVYENNSVSINAAVQNAIGGPQDVTGWAFEFKVVACGTNVPLLTKNSTDPTQISVVTPLSGQLQVYLLPADTVGQQGDDFRYELKGIDTFGRAVTLAQGRFTVLPTII